jgi:hypothetical protein
MQEQVTQNLDDNDPVTEYGETNRDHNDELPVIDRLHTSQMPTMSFELADFDDRTILE